MADIQLTRWRELLKERDSSLELTALARDWLGNEGYDPLYGARPLKRAIQTAIEKPLSKQILEGRFVARDTIGVQCTSGQFRFEKLAGAAEEKAA